MTDTPVLYDVADAIAVLTLNRPDRLNAWTPQLGQEYAAALDRADNDPNVRVVVVTGAGRGWCAGADMDLLAGATEGGVRASSSERSHHRFEPLVRKPVIAAINGACAGLGLVHAAYCDLRFAATGAKFTTSFSRRGLVAEYGLGWLLPRLIGFGNSMDILLSGRVFDADEAHRLGFVQRVVAPDELLPATLEYAAELATWASPASMCDIKRQLWEDAGRSLDESAARATELMNASFARPDIREGVASHVEKRPPRFASLP